METSELFSSQLESTLGYNCFEITGVNCIYREGNAVCHLSK